MKKKIIILLSVVIILLMGIVVWFNIPLDLMDLDPNEVMEIVVFNGNSGNATHITDKEQIQHIVENLNGVEVKRSKLSFSISIKYRSSLIIQFCLFPLDLIRCRGKDTDSLFSLFHIPSHLFPSGKTLTQLRIRFLHHDQK